MIDTLDAMLEPHLFPKDSDNPNPRNCPTCKDGQLSLKFGKFGGFIGCKNYPTCKYTRQLSNSDNSNSSLDLQMNFAVRFLKTRLPCEIWIFPELHTNVDKNMTLCCSGVSK